MGQTSMNQWSGIMKQGFEFSIMTDVLLLGLAVVVSGCGVTSGFKPMFVGETPQLDAKFGDAVRAARASQTLDPEAGVKNAGKQPTMDAESAVNSVQTSRETFKTPPPTFTILGSPVQPR
jgi:hypothetical protein